MPASSRANSIATACAPSTPPARRGYTNEVCGTATGVSTSPISVTLNQATFSSTDTLVATVTAAGGVIATPVDAYVVVEVGGGAFLSLQLDGRLVPGLVPIARNIMLPSVSMPFAFPLAGVPPGWYRWLAAVTYPRNAHARLAAGEYAVHDRSVTDAVLNRRLMP